MTEKNYQWPGIVNTSNPFRSISTHYNPIFLFNNSIDQKKNNEPSSLTHLFMMDQERDMRKTLHNLNTAKKRKGERGRA